MRDPKTHAKVRELRREALYKASTQALANNDRKRRRRLLDLADRINATALDENGRVEWRYCTWSAPPHWRRTEIISDTEEEA